MKPNIVDHNYNAIAVTEDGQEYLIFSERLHNENLDNWKGWNCAAGYNYLVIDAESNVYGSMCKNDYLGNLNSEFQILNTYTICKRDRCILCAPDLSVSKFKVKK
jgi:hypothetical protein